MSGLRWPSEEGYNPEATETGLDALDQAASYLDLAVTRARRWPEVRDALQGALNVLRESYRQQAGKEW